MTQVCVRNVANEDPPDLEHAFPLIRCPDSTAPCVVDLLKRELSQINLPVSESVTDGSHHLSDSTKMAARIDTEEQVNRSPSSGVLESFIQTFVPGIS